MIYKYICIILLDMTDIISLLIICYSALARLVGEVPLRAREACEPAATSNIVIAYISLYICIYIYIYIYV